MSLTIKPKDQCRWDLVGLGEVMLRFDPGWLQFDSHNGAEHQRQEIHSQRDRTHPEPRQELEDLAAD